MRFLPLIAMLAVALLSTSALAEQPLYTGKSQGNVLFYKSLNTQSDLWSWGSLPNWVHYDSLYGEWRPSILYYPQNYYYGYIPYYTGYPWGVYRPIYNPYYY
ncbi:MAG: hypothetical protein A4E48_00332 [Methanosaeta sp. PtaU1.Bin060]|jgi:hypothetical protein|nr:MAG: hypothetical protein A4E48_00332 [Methanosaeta sp. PtaU1.Bin060]